MKFISRTASNGIPGYRYSSAARLKLWETVGYLQDVSANSSFLRLILSLRPSASRRAAAILACICSPDISDDILGGPLLGRMETLQMEGK